MARQPNTTARGDRFDESTIETVWKKGTTEPELPSFPIDVCGAKMRGNDRTTRGRLGDILCSPIIQKLIGSKGKKVTGGANAVQLLH